MPFWLVILALLAWAAISGKRVDAKETGVLRFLYQLTGIHVSNTWVPGFWPFITWRKLVTGSQALPMENDDLLSPIRERQAAGKATPLEQWALVHLKGKFVAVFQIVDPVAYLSVGGDVKEIIGARFGARMRSDFMLRQLARAVDDTEQQTIVRSALDPLNYGEPEIPAQPAVPARPAVPAQPPSEEHPEGVPEQPAVQAQPEVLFQPAVPGLLAYGIFLESIQLVRLFPEDERIDKALQRYAEELLEMPAEVLETAGTTSQQAEAWVATVMGFGGDEKGVEKLRKLLKNPNDPRYADALNKIDKRMEYMQNLRYRREAAAAGNLVVLGEGANVGALFGTPGKGGKDRGKPGDRQGGGRSKGPQGDTTK